MTRGPSAFWLARRAPKFISMEASRSRNGYFDLLDGFSLSDRVSSVSYLSSNLLLPFLLGTGESRGAFFGGVGVIGTADQGAGFNVGEAHLLAGLFIAGKFFG